MSKGINIAENVNKSYNSTTFASARKPVVFLSHKSEDKEFVEGVGNYITNAGIDIYLDKNDFNLQKATQMNNSKEVTKCIEKGISNSDYILCFASKNTVRSWWVPYEIGYGKKANKEIATLLRIDVNEIPEYLKIEEVLDDISDLNNFIKRIANDNSISLLEGVIDYQHSDYIKKASYSHQLSKYLHVR